MIVGLDSIRSVRLGSPHVSSPWCSMQSFVFVRRGAIRCESSDLGRFCCFDFLQYASCLSSSA